MSNQYLGEIRYVSFNYPPRGWAFCNGQLLPINQNQALFALLLTNFGGDGIRSFGLPDLQGRVPLGVDPNVANPGTIGGELTHQLTVGELPPHTHPVSASTARPSLVSPVGATWAADLAGTAYGTSPSAGMAGAALTAAGGGAAHENRPPYLVLNAIIALQGVFPSRN